MRTVKSDNNGKVTVYDIGAGIIKEFKELTVGENVELGEYAFAHCEELANLNVDITKDICGLAFYNCPNLMKIYNEWFMKSDSRIDSKKYHTNWELYCPSPLHSFQWNEMPQCNDIVWLVFTIGYILSDA